MLGIFTFINRNILKNNESYKQKLPKFITFLKNMLIQHKLKVEEFNNKLKVIQSSDLRTFECNIDVEKIKVKETKKWNDILETNVETLAKLTPFTIDEIKQIQKRSPLPNNNAPIYIVARDDKNVIIPKEATIIRFNGWDNDKRTTLRFTWGHHISDFLHKFSVGPGKLVKWNHPPLMKDYGFWNTSSPLVIPRNEWNMNQLRQTLIAKTPLYFLKSDIWSEGKKWMDCPIVDGIGSFITDILFELKAPKILVGMSLTSDDYNFYNKVEDNDTIRNRWNIMIHMNIYNAILTYS